MKVRSQLPFPAGKWDHQICGMAGQGFIGKGHMHGTPVLVREIPWKSRNVMSLEAYSLPCVHVHGNVDGIVGQ